MVKHYKKGNLSLQNKGRLPWYRSDGQVCDCYLVGVAGGSASGKTSVSERIIQNLGVPWVVVLSMDSFYKSLTPEKKQQALENNYNFDHPDAFDYDILYESLKKLKQGKSVEIPVYDFQTHSRLDTTKTIYGANVIVFEGIFAFYSKAVMDLMDLKIFVDTDSDIRLARRLRRDICERARDPAGVLQQYNRFVKPSFDEYIQPTVKHADVIIPRGLDNIVAIDLITKHMQRQLQERNLIFREKLANTPTNNSIPSNVTVLKQTNQLKGLHTIIRDKTTSRDDFTFYANRLVTLLIERGLEEFVFEDTTVTTPCDEIYKGKVFKAEHHICGVPILRAGSAMESGLRRVCKDATIGKILIQTDPSTGEPQLHYCKLPSDLSNSHILLMDAQIATGAAGMMALRVLLDHDVPEDRIVFLSILSTPQGLHAISKAFPKVRIVTSMVDPGLSHNLFIEPGMGNFGDRYFGTE
ncbi:Uridine kinase [Basidiobolus ranarum]|uniref:Uridine kinase n=1 Tax=Basidiobolus ranarum TaxID=34480 RepID=A0ABR2VZB5_9FUNG